MNLLLRLVLGKLLSDPSVKTKIMAGLRDAAKSTDTKIDDEAVDAFEVIWDIALPIIVSK